MNKKMKKALITTSTLGLAISSFFGTKTEVPEITYKEEKVTSINNSSKIINNTKEEKQITRSDVARILSIAASIVAIVFRFIGKAIVSLFKGANSHSFLISIILDTLSIFIIVFSLFLIIFKLIYPDRPLKKLLTTKNIIIIFFASIIISIILNSLDLFNEQKYLCILIESIASTIVLFSTYTYVLRSKSKILIGPRALIKTKKGKRTILLMFVSIIIGTVVKALLTKLNILVPITNLILVIILLFGLATIIVALRKKKLVRYSIEFPEVV